MLEDIYVNKKLSKLSLVLLLCLVLIILATWLFREKTRIKTTPNKHSISNYATVEFEVDGQKYTLSSTPSIIETKDTPSSINNTSLHQILNHAFNSTDIILLSKVHNK